MEWLYFGNKQLNFFTKFIIHFLTYRVERLFNSEICCLLVLLISFRLGGIWIVGSQVDAQLNGSVAENCLMVLQLTSNLHDVNNSVNKSSRIKHYVYSESDKTLDKLVVIQFMNSCRRSTLFIGHSIWPRIIRYVSKELQTTEGKNQALVGAIPFCGEYPGPRFEDKFRSSNQMDGISIADGGKMVDS